MRNCPKCDFVIENNNAKFCKKCGTPLSDTIKNVQTHNEVIHNGFTSDITDKKTDKTNIEDEYNKFNQDEIDLRQLVNQLIESDEYKEAYKMCMRYIKENRCKSVAHELSQNLVPLMKKQNQKQNRKQIIVVALVTIIVMLLSILLNS